MDPWTEFTSSPVAVCAALGLIAGSVAVWAVVLVRWWLGWPVLPYRPRRPVPWGCLQVFLVLIAFQIAGAIAVVLVICSSILFPTSDTRPTRNTRSTSHIASHDAEEPANSAEEPANNAEEPANNAEEPEDVEHPIVDLLGADDSLNAWLLCVFMAVVAAPITEEFAYRLVLQGWLEALERKGRRWSRALRWLRPGLIPVVVASLLFAGMHFRTSSDPMAPEILTRLMGVGTLLNLVTFGILVVYLWDGTRATAIDFGIVPGKLAADVRLGLLACLAVVAPVMVVQGLFSKYVLPENVAADPIPLFFLAMVLGGLYYRTHRIVPAIVAHMAFNATSLFLLWCVPEGL